MYITMNLAPDYRNIDIDIGLESKNAFVTFAMVMLCQSGSALHCIGVALMITVCQSFALFCAVSCCNCICRAIGLSTRAISIVVWHPPPRLHD